MEMSRPEKEIKDDLEDRMINGIVTIRTLIHGARQRLAKAEERAGIMEAEAYRLIKEMRRP